MYWFLTSADCGKCGRCGTATPGTLPAQACGNDYDEDGHGTHVAGSPAANEKRCCHHSHPPGTIAGSSNLATDTTPLSTRRNNGVAGASDASSDRGARLFFQARLSAGGFDFRLLKTFGRTFKTRCRMMIALLPGFHHNVM
jgi:hypothetical protein